MYRIILVCAGVLALTGCDLFNFDSDNDPPLVPTPPSSDSPVFERHFRGGTNNDFAVLRLYKNHFTQSRLVLEASKLLDSIDFDLALPDCLKLPGGSNTGSYQWKKILVQPGTYEKVVDWEQFAPNCPTNGTMFFTISSGPNGDSGSIPFEWLPDGS